MGQLTALSSYRLIKREKLEERNTIDVFTITHKYEFKFYTSFCAYTNWQYLLKQSLFKICTIFFKNRRQL